MELLYSSRHCIFSSSHLLVENSIRQLNNKLSLLNNRIFTKVQQTESTFANVHYILTTLNFLNY